MATKIVTCPSCKKPCTWHPMGGIQCVKCGHGCPRLNLNVQAKVPQGKIKTEPIKHFDLDVVAVHVETGKQINLF